MWSERSALRPWGRRIGPLTVAIGLVLAVPACSRAPREEKADPRPDPATRLVEVGLQGERGKRAKEPVWITLSDVSVPAFRAPRSVRIRPRCTPAEEGGATLRCEITIPRGLGAARAIVETARAHRPGEQPKEARVETSSDKLHYVLTARPDRHELTLPKPATRSITAYPADSAAGELVAKPGMIRDGATLRFSFGTEPAAWFVDSAPLDFVVLARRDGKNVEIFRRSLDPARRAEDRGWQTGEAPLEAVAGDVVQLVFSTRPTEPNDKRPSLPVWGDPTIVVPNEKARQPRRIVLVSLDTLRARSMSAYGREIETTPAFESLAREGTLFERAFTTYSNTLGAHMSMFTGLYPNRHQVSLWQPRLGASIPTLAERLRGAGYQTGAFTEDGLLRAEAGFRRGFGHYFENRGVEANAGDAAGTFRRALAWMKDQGDLPFFAFLHTYEVHYPYAPPADAKESLARAATSAPAEEDSAIPEVHSKNKQAYEAEVVHLDRLLDELVKGLATLGAPEELLLIVTADHGEEFFEHQTSRHYQLYDEVLHVPLLMRWPEHVDGGRVVDAPVSLADVVPTVLALAGLPAMEKTDGVSLVPLLEGKPIARDSVMAQAPRVQIPELDRTGRYAARSATAKCIVADEPDWVECYDLAADPEERHPLAPGDNPAFAPLHEQALEYRRLALEVAQHDPRKSKRREKLDEDTEEKLRVLGYVE